MSFYPVCGQADAGYQGHLVDWAAMCLRMTVDIVRNLAD